MCIDTRLKRHTTTATMADAPPSTTAAMAMTGAPAQDVYGDAFDQRVATLVYATHTAAGHAPAPGTVYGSLVARFPEAAHATVRHDGTVADLGSIKITRTTTRGDGEDGSENDDNGGDSGGITHVVALFHRVSPGLTSHEGYIRRKTAFMAGLTALRAAVEAGQIPVGGIVFPFHTGCGRSGCRWKDYRPLIDIFSASLPDGFHVLVAIKAS